MATAILASDCGSFFKSRFNRSPFGFSLPFNISAIGRLIELRPVPGATVRLPPRTGADAGRAPLPPTRPRAAPIPQRAPPGPTRCRALAPIRAARRLGRAATASVTVSPLRPSSPTPARAAPALELLPLPRWCRPGPHSLRPPAQIPARRGRPVTATAPATAAGAESGRAPPGPAPLLSPHRADTAPGAAHVAGPWLLPAPAPNRCRFRPTLETAKKIFFLICGGRKKCIKFVLAGQ